MLLPTDLFADKKSMQVFLPLTSRLTAGISFWDGFLPITRGCMLSLRVCLGMVSLILLFQTKLKADELHPAPSPVDNPLKGLVPYADPHPDRFPHSMEFSYLPLNDLMHGMDDFRWDALEKLLDRVASRGNQTVFRVFLEYPDKTEGIPPFLMLA